MQIKTTMIYLLTLVRMDIIKKSTNFGRIVGMQTGTITTEKNIKVLQKIKNNTTT